MTFGVIAATPGCCQHWWQDAALVAGAALSEVLAPLVRSCMACLATACNQHTTVAPGHNVCLGTDCRLPAVSLWHIAPCHYHLPCACGWPDLTATAHGHSVELSHVSLCSSLAKHCACGPCDNAEWHHA